MGFFAGDGYSARSEEEEGFKAGREADPYSLFAGHFRSGYDGSRRAADVDDEALARRAIPQPLRGRTTIGVGPVALVYRGPRALRRRRPRRVDCRHTLI